MLNFEICIIIYAAKAKYIIENCLDTKYFEIKLTGKRDSFKIPSKTKMYNCSDRNKIDRKTAFGKNKIMFVLLIHDILGLVHIHLSCFHRKDGFLRNDTF